MTYSQKTTEQNPLSYVQNEKKETTNQQLIAYLSFQKLHIFIFTNNNNMVCKV